MSTREASDDNYDLPLLENMLDGIDKRSGYDTMVKTNTKEFNSWVETLQPAGPGEEGMTADDIQFYKDHPVESHYFFPNSRKVMIEKLDRDRDGVRDVGDTMFNVVYPKRVDASGGYDPLDPGAPLDGLEGTVISNSVNQLNLFARYAVLPPGLLGNTPWNPEVFQPAGFYEGASSDLKAFKFEVDAANGKIKVAVNSNFAHAPAEAMGRMLAVEAGQFLAAQANLDQDKAAALSLSLLERMHHQEGDGNSWSSNKVESAEVKEQLLMQRYGLALSLKDLMAATGNPDDFTAATFETLVQKVQGTPALQGLATVAPRRATEALVVPADMQVSGNLERDALQALVGRLGVTGTVDASAHQWGAWTSPGSRLVVTMQDAQQKPFYVSIGIDSEGVVRAASRIAAQPS